MNKTGFECDLRDFAKSLIEKAGRKPEYGGFRMMVRSGDISVSLPDPHSVTLQVGHLCFRYCFRMREDYSGYDGGLVAVTIVDFDAAVESGEFERIKEIREQLRKIENENKEINH